MSTSLQSNVEHKQAESLTLGGKDDFKQQTAELRKSRGIAGDAILNDAAFMHPHLSADPLAPRATVPLEPTVQAPRKIEHSSIPDNTDSRVLSSSTTTISSSSTSSSGPALMEKVGEQAGASIDAAKSKLEPLLQPVVAKATSIYDQWKGDNTDSTTSDSTGPSIQERATAAGADLKERATVAASQAQTVYREQVAPAITDAANQVKPMLAQASAQAKPMLVQASAQAKPLLAQASAQVQVAAAQARPVIENAIEQAKPILANAAATATKIYNEQVQPALASGLTAAQEQLGVIREDGLSVTMEKAGTAYRRNVDAAKTTINETYEAKVPLEQRKQIAKAKKGAATQISLGWNRAVELWQTQALPFIRERNLQAPLAIAASVLALLLGWTILSALSSSKASHEQVVVYQPNWRPSNGPVQGVEMPGLMDKAGAKISAIDNKIIDGIDTIKARSADLAQHAEDSINMGIDSIKVHAQELQQGIPSTADIKARAESALHSARAAIPSTADVKAPIKEASVIDNIKTGAADLKARVNSAVHPAPIKEATVIDNIKETASDLKARVNSAIHPAPIKEATVLDNIKESASDLKARVNSAIHPAPVKESVLDNIKDSAADLKARVNSAIHPAPIKEATVLDHVKETASDLKARVNSAIHPAPVKEATIIDNIKDGVADIESRVESNLHNAKLQAENIKLRAEAKIHSARASVPSTADIKASAESKLDQARASIPSATPTEEASTIESIKDNVSELRLKINDRLEHVKALLPEQLSALRLRLGGLYERLTPAQRHYAHAHPEIMDPENHAVSFVDSHGNVKSILDVDLE